MKKVNKAANRERESNRGGEGRLHSQRSRGVCVCVCDWQRELSKVENTSWMWGCIVSMCVHPRHSRGLVPGSIQHKLGHIGDICWVKPALTLHLNPHRAVAIVKHTANAALGNVNRDQFQV